MSVFWKQIERRACIAAYGYSLGDEAKPEHIDLTKSNQSEIVKLEVGDSVFVKRSNGTWGFATLTKKSSDRNGYTYQIGRDHKFKSFREDQLGEYVRLVEVGNQRASSELDIDQSLSCESFTDRVVQSRREIINDGDDKENAPHSNTVKVSEHSTSRSVEHVMKNRRSLSFAKHGSRTRQLSTGEEDSIFSIRTEVPEAKVVTGNKVQQGLPNSKQCIPKTRRTSMNYSSILQRSKPPLSPLTILTADVLKDIDEAIEIAIVEATNEQLEEEKEEEDDGGGSIDETIEIPIFEAIDEQNKDDGDDDDEGEGGSSFILEDLIKAEFGEDQSKTKIQSSMSNQLTAANKHTANSVHRNKSCNNEHVNGEMWRVNSDPDIVFTPFVEKENAKKNENCSSDPDTAFLPDEYSSDNSSSCFDFSSTTADNDRNSVDESDQTSTTRNRFCPDFSDQTNNLQNAPEEKCRACESNENEKRRNIFGTFKFFARKSRQKDSFVDQSDQTSTTRILFCPSPCDQTNNLRNVSEKMSNACDQKGPSNENERRRNIFGKFKLFARKSRQKESFLDESDQTSTARNLNRPSPDHETQNLHNISEEMSNVCEQKDPSNEENNSGKETNDSKIKSPSEPSRASFGQPYHYTQPKLYSYQNVYYVSDPKLAQSYRDYAHYVTRQQYSQQYEYNPLSYYAQYVNAHNMANYQMTQMDMSPSQPPLNFLQIPGATYHMTSIGNGIQIGMPCANVTRINIG